MGAANQAGADGGGYAGVLARGFPVTDSLFLSCCGTVSQQITQNKPLNVIEGFIFECR